MKKLIIGIIFVLLLLSVCITIDFADEPIIVTENQTENNTSNCTLIDGVYYDNKIVSNSKQHIKNYNVVTVKPKVPLISITAKPSCSCGRHYSYRWRTRTFVNYCPHCNRYNALVNKHKYPARHEQELTCKYDDCDYCGNCGKEKYSWSNYRLKKV
ncbi:MAG: hypothetical protein IJI96_03460 [Methanobrevibacter sp.]|nr:hypothetical protein [Methanobrevibacter sp.]